MSKNTIIKAAQEAVKNQNEAMELFNALKTDFTNTSNNADLYSYMNQTITAKLVKMVVNTTVKDTYAVADVVYTFTVNDKTLNYSILRASVRNGEFKEYNMYRYFTNSLFNAAKTNDADTLIGKSYKCIVFQNENGYNELKVVGLA